MNSSRLNKYTIYHNNSEEYHNLKREVFTSDLYYFETENPQPVIIDAGAHIGLATLYFKQLYPGAQITALEPNPESFQLLEKNLFENMIDDVTTVQVALSDHSGEEHFFAMKQMNGGTQPQDFIKVRGWVLKSQMKFLCKHKC